MGTKIIRGQKVVDYVDNVMGTDGRRADGIGVERNGELIAGWKFDNFCGASICVHVLATDRGWKTKEFLDECFNFAFVEKGVKKLIGPVPASCKSACKLGDDLGFEREAVIKDMVPTGDLIIFSLTKQKYGEIKNVNV